MQAATHGAVEHAAKQREADLTELASLLSSGYLRLLASRSQAAARQNLLDSPEQESDELAMTTRRRRRRA